MNINIEEILLKEAMKKIDLDQYLPQVEAAVDAYFKSDDFYGAVSECFTDEGLGWEFAEAAAKRIKGQFKNLKVELSL